MTEKKDPTTWGVGYCTAALTFKGIAKLDGMSKKGLQGCEGRRATTPWTTWTTSPSTTGGGQREGRGQRKENTREERDVGEFYSLLNEQMERLLYKVPPAALSADNKEGAKK